MAKHDPPRPEDTGAHCGDPWFTCVGDAEPIDLRLDLDEHQLGECVENRVLARKVMVDRHRLDPELVGEAPHREGCDAIGICQAHRGIEDAGLRQGDALGLALARCHASPPSQPYIVRLPLDRSIRPRYLTT
jgi:hypothetical protein